jgi:16S rRNA (cytidine1402-2'-O)-methyltransferase
VKGTLFLIPNSLGAGALDQVLTANVRAITADLDYFIAENAKTARAFLNQVAVTHPLRVRLQDIDIRELNVKTPRSVLPDLLAPLLGGRDGGMVSEAGVPAVADPGADLVRLAHESGIRIRPLVGPSSILLALMSSGLSGQNFAFNGYLPTDATERANRIRQLEQRSKQEQQTQIFIETPYRNEALLQALSTHCQPGTQICIATHLTLEDESIQRMSAQSWKREIAENRMPDFRKKPTVFLMLAP